MISCNLNKNESLTKSAIDFNRELLKIQDNADKQGMYYYSKIYFNFEDNKEDSIAKSIYNKAYKLRENTGKLIEEINKLEQNILNQKGIRIKQNLIIDSLDVKEIALLTNICDLDITDTERIRGKLIQYCDSVSNYLDSNVDKISITFVANQLNPNIKYANINEWHENYFKGLPGLLLINNLESLQTDLRICESEIVNKLNDKIKK